MITRCPECSTLFKVVADQLKISDGWVRCGRCDHVFDGAANLQDDSVAETTVATPPRLPPSSKRDDTVPADSRGAPPTAASGAAQGSEGPTPRSLQDEFSAMSFQGFGPQDELRTLVPEHPLRDPELGQAAVAPACAEHDLSLPEVSFVRAARTPSVWARPGVRWGLRLSAMLLLFGLSAQVVVRERDRIAATLPESKPWLQALCQPLGCVLGPLKNIDAITVESSSFNRIRADVYRLQVTLKNTARTELALPSVELTLTDTRDAAVLRRVLTPMDFSVLMRSVPAASDWSGSLTVSVPGAVIPSRIAGYRVLAFYPE